jgi:hypothetical protein
MLSVTSSVAAESLHTAMHKLRIVTDFGWEIAHAAVSRHPPISLYAIVPRTHMYAYAVYVWGLSLVQGPFSVAACPTLTLRLATFSSLYAGEWRGQTIG